MTQDPLIVLTQLLIIFLFARAAGVAALKLRQPASVGELVAGAILALLATTLNASWPGAGIRIDPELLSLIQNVAIFILILYAGVELEPREILATSRAALPVAIGGVAVPFAGGFAAVMWTFPESDMLTVQALVAGTILSITSIPAAVKLLEESGALRTRLGEMIVAAALFDDVIGLLLIAVITSVLKTGSVPQTGEFLILLAKIALFFGITGILGTHVYPPVRRRISALQIASLEFSALIFVALAYSVLAEALSLHWVLGAFAAGLYFEPSRVGTAAYDEMKLMLGALSAGVMGPLFFVSIGLRVDLEIFLDMPSLAVALIVVGFLGKPIGAGIPARLSGLSGRDSLAVGAGMSSRGAVELVILSIALEAGVFMMPDGGSEHAYHFYSAAVIMVIVCTALSAVSLGHLLRRDPAL